jgi:hypothetical protein
MAVGDDQPSAAHAAHSGATKPSDSNVAEGDEAEEDEGGAAAPAPAAEEEEKEEEDIYDDKPENAWRGGVRFEESSSTNSETG